MKATNINRVLRSTLAILCGIVFFVGLVAAIPASAAAPAPAAGGPGTVTQFTPSATDYSVSQLITRTFGPILSQDGSVTASGTVGEVFRAFNIGVAFFGSILVLFVTIVGAVQTAHDGEFLGRKWSTVWVPLRFAGASAMLLPMTSSGYSMIQGFVFWVAMQGVGFADFVWTAGINNLPFKANIALQTTMPAREVAQRAMRSALCTAAANKALVDMGETNLIHAYDVSDTKAGVAQVNWGIEGLPGMSSVCGSIRYSDIVFDTNSTAEDKYIASVRQQIFEAHRTALAAMATAFQPAADGYVSALYNTAPGATATDMTSLVDLVNTTAAANVAAVVAIGNAAMGESGATARATFLGKASKDGWATAGSWYLELAKSNSGLTEKIRQTPQTTDIDPVAIENVASPLASHLYGDLTKIFDRALANGSAGLVIGETAPAQAGSIKVTDVSVWDFFRGSVDPTTISASISQRIGEGILSAFVGVKDDRSVVMQMKSAGDTVMNWAGALMSADIALHAVSFFTKSNVSPVKWLNLGEGLSDLAASIAKYIFMIALLLAGLGMMLAIYIPMIPYILWISGVLGWMILLAEAMVASQLWAVMHMNPSGEGFSSDSTRNGYMLLAVLFARPALMIMGFAMGMLIIEPVAGLINDTFYSAMRSVQNANGSFTGPLTIIGFATVYVALMIIVVNRAFALIHVIPDRVLHWVGGGGAQLGESDAEQHAHRTVVAGFGGTRQALNTQGMRPTGGRAGGAPGGGGGGGGGGGPAGGGAAATGTTGANPTAHVGESIARNPGV